MFERVDGKLETVSVVCDIVVKDVASENCPKVVVVNESTVEETVGSTVKVVCEEAVV